MAALSQTSRSKGSLVMLEQTHQWHKTAKRDPTLVNVRQNRLSRLGEAWGLCFGLRKADYQDRNDNLGK